MNPILVATDGSHAGTAAVEQGLSLAAQLGVGVTFVSVRKPPSRMLGDPFYERSIGRGVREAQAVVDDACARAEATGIAAEAEVLEGNPAEEIVTLADNRDSGLIVVGSRSHGPFVGALLGSVSAGVVHHACRPVVIVNGGPPNTWTRAVRAA
jgi:nucleotide-binding universal stress UspA family protein